MEFYPWHCGEAWPGFNQADSDEWRLRGSEMQVVAPFDEEKHRLTSERMAFGRDAGGRAEEIEEKRSGLGVEGGGF